ncbi:hypothetical protein ARTHRO9AX_180202 [Arthrobacter sp. 9AX]|nr:hypothetical protein ARTHRO9AX_180202 [Arthrobacter sp. 9AX]
MVLRPGRAARLTSLPVESFRVKPGALSPVTSLSAIVFLLVAGGTHQPSKQPGAVLIDTWLYLLLCLIWINGPLGASCPPLRASSNIPGTKNSAPSVSPMPVLLPLRFSTRKAP